MSVREGFEALAHAALEGTATAAERAELEAWVASDPALRERWEMLGDAFRALSEVRPEPPPPGLAHDVMRAIRAEQRETAEPASPSWLARALTLRLASAFAAGCVLGVVAVAAVSGWRPSLDGGSTRGTMMPMGAAPGASAALSIQSARATFDVSEDGSSVNARIEARSPGEAAIVLEPQPAMAIEALEGLRSQPRRVLLAPGRITLEFTGRLECTVRFHRAAAAPTALRVTLRSGTEAVQKELRLSRLGPAR